MPWGIFICDSVLTIISLKEAGTQFRKVVLFGINEMKNKMAHESIHMEALRFFIR